MEILKLLRHIRRLLLCLLLLAGSGIYAHAADRIQLDARKIEAGLLFNVLKYSVWPQDAITKGQLNVCLYGGDSFDGALAPLEGKMAQNLTISIIEINQAASGKTCHLVYIPTHHKENLPQILNAVKGAPVLTVSNIPGFAAKGGMVAFSMQEKRVHLLVNMENLAQAKISMEARLLKLAEVVR